jgi:antitoxin YefM
MTITFVVTSVTNLTIDEVYTLEYTLVGGDIMEKTISLKNVRPQLPAVVDEVDTQMSRYIITKRGKPVAIMISIDDYNSMHETLDILADKELVKGIAEGMKDIKAGDTIPWETIKKKHDL